MARTSGRCKYYEPTKLEGHKRKRSYHSLQPLLKRKQNMSETMTKIQIFKIKKKKQPKNTQYSPYLETSIKGDASCTALGALLEQHSPIGWYTVEFSSRFLESKEKRYSVNELECFGVIWSVEYFNYHLFEMPFTITSDHRALLSIMKEH